MRKRDSHVKTKSHNSNYNSSNSIAFDGDGRNSFFIKNSSFFLIGMFIFIIIFRMFIVDRIIISGESMNNTFKDGDVCWVKKFDYEINRDDVIVANIKGQNVIKRVVAVPGDSVEIKDGDVYINDRKYQGKFEYKTNFAGVAENKILLENDEYFILGDNREKSYDSRYYGTVHRNKIKGVVVAKVFPYFKIER